VANKSPSAVHIIVHASSSLRVSVVTNLVVHIATVVCSSGKSQANSKEHSNDLHDVR